MERWTSRDESGYYHLRRILGGKYEPTKKDLIKRVGQYEDTGLEPEDVCGLCEKFQGFVNMREAALSEKGGQHETNL